MCLNQREMACCQKEAKRVGNLIWLYTSISINYITEFPTLKDSVTINSHGQNKLAFPNVCMALDHGYSQLEDTLWALFKSSFDCIIIMYVHMQGCVHAGYSVPVDAEGQPQWQQFSPPTFSWVTVNKFIQSQASVFTCWTISLSLNYVLTHGDFNSDKSQKTNSCLIISQELSY